MSPTSIGASPRIRSASGAAKENLAGTPRTTAYTYDGLDRLTGIDLPTNSDWLFTYDASASLNQKGRLTSASNGTVTTGREYFPRGDIKIERTTIGGASYEVQYGYDAAGNRTSVLPPSGVKVDYAFSGGRPKTIMVNPGANQQVIQNITFDPFGGRTRAEFPPSNSVVSTRSYNLRGQVSSVQVASPAGVVIDRSFDYAYTGGGIGPNDPGPNLDRIIDARDSSQSRFFFYDSLDRFSKSATIAGASLYEYSYDANGNRTIEVTAGAYADIQYEVGTDRVDTSSYDDGSGANYRYYKHDSFGSRIWEGLNPYAGTPSNIYDEQNRLTEYHDSAVPTRFGHYTYDVFGRRVRKVNSSGTMLFFYDTAGHLLEERSLATTPNQVRNYVWLEDEPVGTVDSGSVPLTFSWIHTDYLGMPIAVTDTPTSGNATTIWRASYAPFGQAGLFLDPDGNGQQFALALRFPGQYFDDESSDYYNWHRYYDPSIGRYISADPIGQAGGINLYVYVNNNPARWADSSGLAIGDRPPAPPGYDPSRWSGETNPRGRAVLTDPDGSRWTEHPEDSSHWRHWDRENPDGSKSRWPENSRKPWPGQKRPPYGPQCAEDPSGNQPGWDAEPVTRGQFGDPNSDSESEWGIPDIGPLKWLPAIPWWLPLVTPIPDPI